MILIEVFKSNFERTLGFKNRRSVLVSQLAKELQPYFEMKLLLSDFSGSWLQILSASRFTLGERVSVGYLHFAAQLSQIDACLVAVYAFQ